MDGYSNKIAEVEGLSETEEFNRVFEIHVFEIRGRRVVDERGTLLPRLLALSTTPILAPNVPPVVEVVGGVSSSLPTLGVASVPAASVLPITGVVGGDSHSLTFKVHVRPSEDVNHQGKGKGVVVDEWEKVTPKRTLEDEGNTTGSARFKRGRMARQETARFNSYFSKHGAGPHS
ncbi:hypothetical protein Fot_23203 [Forsythia ovata]|uniref:Uncharacterized protein n=1 Tax=Forsythia ovata TaxID=205694 RepID=A0ABD1V079_9LAMI